MAFFLGVEVPKLSLKRYFYILQFMRINRAINISVYCFIENITTCGTQVPTTPKIPSPLSFFSLLEPFLPFE